MSPRGINRRVEIELSAKDVSRFWSHVDRGEPEACWNWRASTRSGYGAIKVDGRVLSSHRVAYVVEHGEIPVGKIVMHSCDNRLCCNPAHLAAGTPEQNVRDMFARRPVLKCQGEHHHAAVLTEPTVRAIRLIREQTGWGSRRIGRQLGLSEHCVKGVISGRSWKHVAE